MRSLIRPFLFGLLLVAATVGTRAPWLGREIWTLDEGTTFTMAQQVREGAVLYRDAVDQRGPLLPYLKAAIFVVAGDWNAVAVHAVLAVLLGLCAWSLFLLARRLGDPVAGVGSAGAFVILQFFYVDALDNMSATTGWFIVIFSTFGFLQLASARDRPGWIRGLAAGFFFSLSMLSKQPGLLDFVAAMVLVGLLFCSADADRRGLARTWGGMILGFTLPLALTALYFAAHGAWDDYVYYGFTFNTQIYVPEVEFLARLSTIQVPFELAWAHVPILALLAGAAAVGLLTTVARKSFRPGRPLPLLPWLILGWTAAGLIATTLTGRGFPHYSQQLIPGLSLAVGWMLARIWQWEPRRMVAVGRFAAVGLILAATGHAAFRYRKMAPELSSTSMTGLPEGLVVQRHSAPDERLFVWGYLPEAYFYARRLPATRFVYPNFITGMIPWTNIDPLIDTAYALPAGVDEDFHADLSAHPPAVILDTQNTRTYAKFPIAARETLWGEIKSHYAEVAVGAETLGVSRLFRRLNGNVRASSWWDLPEDAAVALSGVATFVEHEPPRLQVTAPAGVDRVDLYVDEELLASVPHPPNEPVAVRFFVNDPLHRWSKESEFRAVVQRGAERHRSAPFDFVAFERSTLPQQSRVPPLHIYDTDIAPRLVTSQSSTLKLHWRFPDAWELVLPARVVFDVPAGVNQITFDHGLIPSAADFSDGYDLQVIWTPVGENQELVLQRRLKAREDYQDRITQSEQIDLRGPSGGQLEFSFDVGEDANGENDHIFFGKLFGQVNGPIIRLGDSWIAATEPIDTVEQPLRRDADGNWLLHAPNRMVWPLPANLMVLNFDYGIDPGAADANATGHTDGVDFSVSIRASDGTSQVLFEDRLEPFSRPDDRGMQSARVEIPVDAQGELIVSTAPGPAGDASWDWSLVGNLRGEASGPPIVLSPDHELMTVETSGHAGGRSDQFSDGEWGAQTPQRLTYLKPADLAAVVIRFGINPNAAADPETGSQRSDGVAAIVRFERPDGSVTELFRQDLNPFLNPNDVGQKSARVELPVGESGLLHILMDPGPAGINSYDWAYWGPFEGILFKETE